MMEEEEEDPLWSPRQSRNNSKGRKKSAAGKRSRRASTTGASRKGGEAKIRTGYGSACNICRTDHRGCDGQRPCFRCVKVGCAVRYLPFPPSRCARFGIFGFFCFFCCGVVLFFWNFVFSPSQQIQSQLRWYLWGSGVFFISSFFIFIYLSLLMISLIFLCWEVGSLLAHTRSFLSIGYRVDREKKGCAPQQTLLFLLQFTVSELILFFSQLQILSSTVFYRFRH